MVDRVNGIYSPPRRPVEVTTDKRPPVPPGLQYGGDFATVLDSQTGSLRFSAHAQERLKTRAIELSEQDRANLARAVDAAGAKGAQESLILLDDLALVVSVRNRVVITALERGDEEAKVFTNIDSAVLLHRNQAQGS